MSEAYPVTFPSKSKALAAAKRLNLSAHQFRIESMEIRPDVMSYWITLTPKKIIREK